MTRTVSAEIATALQARRLRARDFIWIVARTRDTGAPVPDGMWSDDYDITADVIDPDTGGTVSRNFTGAGALVNISDIPLVSNITVQTVTVTLSQISEHVASLVRQYDCKQATVQIFRGLFDPATNTMVAPAVPRFVGFVDHIDITTPKENAEGSVVLSCVSHTQEMTRSNSDTRSNASQSLRHSGDNFFNDVAVVASWQHFWGKGDGTLHTINGDGKQLD